MKLKDYFKTKNGFWWALAWEFILMFSNEPSLFASKRFERFIMFWIAMWTIMGYVKRNWLVMGIGEISAITGILLFGAAWNATQIRKDQQAKPE